MNLKVNGDTVLSWRKANAIHNWFVRNVQQGKDDCNEYAVSRVKLLVLQALCTHVLKNPEDAAVKLPVKSGVFFGSKDYDDYYFKTLSDTVVNLTQILSGPHQSFTYEATW